MFFFLGENKSFGRPKAIIIISFSFMSVYLFTIQYNCYLITLIAGTIKIGYMHVPSLKSRDREQNKGNKSLKQNVKISIYDDIADCWIGNA